jgi:hypothetical protein
MQYFCLLIFHSLVVPVIRRAGYLGIYRVRLKTCRKWHSDPTRAVQGDGFVVDFHGQEQWLANDKWTGREVSRMRDAEGVHFTGGDRCR